MKPLPKPQTNTYYCIKCNINFKALKPSSNHSVRCPQCSWTKYSVMEGHPMFREVNKKKH